MSREPLVAETMKRTDTPILIVGAGPGGLTAAVTLAHYGIDFLLVEKRPELSSLPRATGVSTRTMELMRSFGIEDEIRAGGDEVEWLQCMCESLAMPTPASTFQPASRRASSAR